MSHDTHRSDTAVSLDERIRRARQHLVDAVAPDPPTFGRLRARVRRRQALSGCLAAVALVATLAVIQGRGVDGSETVTTDQPAFVQPGDHNRTLLNAGEVRAMAPSPLAGRSTMASVWTGTQFVIWGGETAQEAFDDGAAYDPATDSWRSLAPSPLSARNAPAAVWTGETMILWGGHAKGVDHRDGAVYDPATDTWTPVADAPMASAGLPQAVWTGSEMLVLAGFNSTAAAAYDPATDTWRKLEPVPGRPLGPPAQALWTGEQLVTRAAYPSTGAEMRGGIFAYTPADDRWEELAGSTHDGGHTTTLAWTGQQLIRVTQQPGAVIAAYDLDGAEGTGLNTWPSDVPLVETSAWTGGHLLLWGGGDEAIMLDPGTGELSTTPAGGGSKRTYPASVWADGILLIWGGWQDRADGILLRPVDPVPGAPGTTVTIPSSATERGDPDLVPVAGPDGTVGYIDNNSGPAEVNGRVLPLQRVVDDEGDLIGYFGCFFLERDVVENADFDAGSICATATTVTAED